MKKLLHDCLSFLSEMEVRSCPKEVQVLRTSLNRKRVVENGGIWGSSKEVQAAGERGYDFLMVSGPRLCDFFFFPSSALQSKYRSRGNEWVGCLVEIRTHSSFSLPSASHAVQMYG